MSDPSSYEPPPPGPSGITPFYVLGLVTGILATLIVLRLRGEDPDVEHYGEVRDFVRESYVREISDQELLEQALRGMLESLDPYSRYYDAEERERLDRETYGRYAGVGVVFRPPVAEGQLLFALPGSPADRAGLRVGDTLVAIDGRSVLEMGEEQMRAELSREETELEVELRGLDGELRTVQLRPSQVVDPTIRHAKLIAPDQGVGYISISSFSRETSAEFDRAFEFLFERGMQALILDLRYNFGGVLDAAEDIAGRFIPEGAIVSTEGRGQPLVTRAEPERARHAGFPIVVLVDEDSASASEVLAGALQDHRRAVIVGAPTYGKGLVQTVRRFEKVRSVAKVTTSYYYSPAGRNFERTAQEGRDYGILPDVHLPVDQETARDIHIHLRGYGPPVTALAALEAWEAESGLDLIEPHPHDPQLRAALELLEGTRPGPWQLSPAPEETE